MPRSHESEDSRKRIDDLLNIPHQTWLLGAGISCEAHVPLMNVLTARVSTLLKEQAPEYHDCLEALRNELPESAHIEHVLSHIGDLVAIAHRSKDGQARTKKKSYSRDFLTTLHSFVQQHIRDTVSWGYRPADPSTDSPEIIGTRQSPILKIDFHREFVRALFHSRRAGLERRPPVAFFTTNYDTLLEDALALERLKANDGFAGGSMAFWEPSDRHTPARSPFSADGCHATIFKLHGSIDWFASDEDVVVRRREGAAYPPPDAARLVIYPQATKYQLTQRDPFASLFASFRNALSHQEQSLLAICGYSFSDDHINEEIERALKHRNNRLTVLVFSYQPDGSLPEGEGLPKAVEHWLSDGSGLRGDSRQRIVVAGRRGVYHGSLANRCPSTDGACHAWWSFSGLTAVLSKGTGHSL